MLLRLSANSLVNTIIMDSNDQRIYTIVTPTAKLFKSTPGTRILAADGNEIALVQWHGVHNTTVVYKGMEMNGESFVQSGKDLHGKHTFMGPDGTFYRWKKHSGMPPDLIRPAGQGKGDEKLIMRIVTTGFLHRHTTMEIDSEGKHMMELIIVAVVCMERQRLEEETEYGTATDL